MFPLLERERANPLELFQIWLNLPAADKLVDPYFTMLWDDDLRRHHVTDDRGPLDRGHASSPATSTERPPRRRRPTPVRPDHDADVAIWHLRLEPGATWTLPAARRGDDTVRVLYVFEGDTLQVAGTEVGNDTGVVVQAGEAVTLTAGAAEVDALLLQGVPIGEPVARYGPFVMNTAPRSSRPSRTTRTRGSAAGRGRTRPRPTGPPRTGSPATPTGEPSARWAEPQRHDVVAAATAAAASTIP